MFPCCALCIAGFFSRRPWNCRTLGRTRKLPQCPFRCPGIQLAPRWCHVPRPGQRERDPCNYGAHPLWVWSAFPMPLLNLCGGPTRPFIFPSSSPSEMRAKRGWWRSWERNQVGSRFSGRVSDPVCGEGSHGPAAKPIYSWCSAGGIWPSVSLGCDLPSPNLPWRWERLLGRRGKTGFVPVSPRELWEQQLTGRESLGMGP